MRVEITNKNTEKNKSLNLEKIILSKPWLLPFIVYLARNPRGLLYSISNILGVKSSITRRALWWLSKIGIVELYSEDNRRLYSVKNTAIDTLSYLTSNVRYYNKNYVLKIGSEYILVRVRRTRILSYTIPVEIVERVENVLKNAPGQEFTLEDLALSTNISLRLLIQVIRIMKILDIIEKKREGYILKI